MWDNLRGINYNSDGPGYNPTVDLPRIQQAGFKKVRLLIQNWDYADGITLWKNITQQALALKFKEVIFGLNFHNYSVANQAGHTAAVTSLANWFMQQTIPSGTRFVFCLGNEESYHISDGSTQAQVRAYYRTLYTAIKAILTNPSIDLTYSMANGEMFSFYTDFNSNSLPYPWDYPTANLYAYPVNQTNGTYFKQNILNAIAWFGTNKKFVISEFAPDPAGYSDSIWQNKSFYDAEVRQLMQYIVDANNDDDVTAHINNIGGAYFYNYMSSNFGVITFSGTENPWWYTIRGLRKSFNTSL